MNRQSLFTGLRSYTLNTTDISSIEQIGEELNPENGPWTGTVQEVMIHFLSNRPPERRLIHVTDYLKLQEELVGKRGTIIIQVS